MTAPTTRQTWTDLLEDEELAFLKRFVLTGGSLKDLAALYSVTYPTVRLRLDRLIAKIQIFDRQDIADDFERLLRAQYADGKFDATTFKRLLAAYHRQLQPAPANIHEVPPPVRAA